jgi:hypothetical protein
MAETTRLVDCYYVQVAQKVGEGAKVLRALKDAGVNLVAFSGFRKDGEPNSVSFPLMWRH